MVWCQCLITYLNSISYAGSNQWRLPTFVNTSDATFFPTTNGTAAGSELPELFYNELGGKVQNSIPNTATFDNEQPAGYWSGNEYAPAADRAWYFDANGGAQYLFGKNYQFYAWAVSPGQIATVSAVPVPAAAWLFGSGVLGLVGLRRRRG